MHVMVGQQYRVVDLPCPSPPSPLPLRHYPPLPPSLRCLVLSAILPSIVFGYVLGHNKCVAGGRRGAPGGGGGQHGAASTNLTWRTFFLGQHLHASDGLANIKVVLPPSPTPACGPGSRMDSYGREAQRTRALAGLTHMWKPAYHRRYRIIQGVGPRANSGGRGETTRPEFFQMHFGVTYYVIGVQCGSSVRVTRRIVVHKENRIV